ncbi:hypothetical protein [Providencia sp.]|uniref:hypothetical protein n=1 Tax=Providencia sp. TaxID=589 RepID=UPI0035B2120A
MKRNIDDFDGMKDFIISIVTVIAWVLIGTIVIIGYFTIDTKGESIIISFVSMVFTIISSLGIAVTIGGYIWQKSYTETLKEKEKNELKKSIKKIAENELININIDFESASSSLNQGDIDKCSSILLNINTETIQKCAYDSAKINEYLFYQITDVITEILEHKRIILENLKKENSCNDESIELNNLYCQQAIAQIESYISSILAV